MSTLNMKARSFALRELFLADPDEGWMVASVALRELADLFCESRGCSDPIGCRRHTQAMLLGVAKLMIDREVLAEMSPSGFVYVRLSPVGVLSPLAWSSQPLWFWKRPELVEWARAKLVVTGSEA